MFSLSQIQDVAKSYSGRNNEGDPPVILHQKVSTTKCSNMKTKVTVKNTMLSSQEKRWEENSGESDQQLALNFQSISQLRRMMGLEENAKLEVKSLSWAVVPSQGVGRVVSSWARGDIPWLCSSVETAPGPSCADQGCVVWEGCIQIRRHSAMRSKNNSKKSEITFHRQAQRLTVMYLL